MRTITVRHSLAPRSLTRFPNSLPRGSPATDSMLQVRGGESGLPLSRFCRTRYDPNCTDRCGTLRLAPVYSPAALRRRTPISERSNLLRTIFGSGLTAALARFKSRGSSTIHIRCACGTCLAPTPHRGSQRRHPVTGSNVFRGVLCPGSFVPDRCQSRTSR
jgi:hypothetical protein